MSDPFANLLDSFKQGAVKKKPQQAPIPSAGPGGSASQPVKDDLDLLFNNAMPTATATANNTNNMPPTQSNDDWDKAFDIFNSTATNDSTTVPSEEYNGRESTPQEEVVDEVKDMEIAQIMSLGYTFDQALHYYNKGLSYETLLQRQMPPSQVERERVHSQRNHFDLERDAIPVGAPSVGETLMDSAWNVFNKSKKIVDSWTQFDSNEKNRLRQGRGDTQMNSLYQGEEEENDDFEQDYQNIDEFHNEFNDKLNLNHSPSTSPSPTPTPTPPTSQNDNNLLDFDIPESAINTNTTATTPSVTTHNTLLDIDQTSTSHNTLLDLDQPSAKNNTTAATSPQTIKSPISDIELLSYNEFKDNATQLFKNGHYAEALEQYTKSLNTLPQTHPLRLIAISNMMISQLKIGEYTNIIKLNESCHKLYPNDENDWKCIIPNSDPNRTFKDIWSKIMLRYAEALEHLENHEKALTTYQDMIDKNITSTKVLEGKRRCEKVINPEKFKPTPTPSRNTPVPTPITKKSVDNSSPKNTENIDRIKQINVNLEKEADLKVKLYDQVELKINNWKANKSDDIRYLLSNLSTVITWTNWNPVSTADLVMPKKVKVTYMKAVARTHPDKIPASLDLENKMIAENVFTVLSEAWEKFKLENNIT